MTADKVIKKAVSQLGIKEAPANSNNVKYNTWYYRHEVNGSAYQWCMAFVQWVFAAVGYALPLRTASCTALMNYAKQYGNWVTRNYRPGDVILFQFDSDPLADHTGICESVSGNYITCIEGNTSEAGSQSNGGMVCRKKRRLSLVMGAYRPDYTEKAANTGTSVPKPSGSTTVKSKLTVDGVIGKNTVKTLQKFLGTTADGAIDGQYSKYKPYWTALDGSVCRWNGGKSAAVKALQKLVGTASDGVLGKGTAKALQQYLIKKGFPCGSAGADGCFGRDSAKALQRFLNSK